MDSTLEQCGQYGVWRWRAGTVTDDERVSVRPLTSETAQKATRAGPAVGLMAALAYSGLFLVAGCVGWPGRSGQPLVRLRVGRLVV